MRKILELVEWQAVVMLLGMIVACGLLAAGGADGWIAFSGAALLTASATWGGMRSGRRTGRMQAEADIAEHLGEGWQWPPTYSAEGIIHTFRIDEPRKVLMVVSDRELRIEEARGWGWGRDEHSVRISCTDEADSETVAKMAAYMKERLGDDGDDAEIADFVSSVLDQPGVKKAMKEGSK